MKHALAHSSGARCHKNLIDVLRILHDSMDLVRHLDTVD